MSRTVIQIRCSAEQKAAWSEKAKSKGLSLSNYIKTSLDRDATTTPGIVSALFAKRS